MKNLFKNIFKNSKKKIIFSSIFSFLIPFLSFAGGTAAGAKALGVSFIKWIGWSGAMKLGGGLLTAVTVGSFWQTILLNTLSFLKSLVNVVIYTAGYLYDNALLITISPGFYSADWIKLAWGTLRDISNIAFIFGIIMIGFLIILGKTSQWKRMLVNLIIVAFIMNFSMFFARVIIDAGNFTAAIFYSMNSGKIEGEDLSDRFYIADAVRGDKTEPYFGYRSFSAVLVAFGNPTSLFSNEQLKKDIDEYQEKEDNGEKPSGDIAGQVAVKLAILNVVFIFIMILFSYALVRATFMFLSRTIHLVKWIISAPVYFALYFLPGGDKKLNEWFTGILTTSFCATGYLAGMWVLLMFMGSESIKEISSPDFGKHGLLGIIAIVGVKFIFIYVALNKLTDMGTKSCNEGEAYGEKIAQWTKGLAGFVGGGAVGMIGKNVAFNSARSMVGAQGQAFRERSAKFATSKFAPVRFLGDKMLQTGNSLYGAKIGNKSFKDEVDSRQKREGEMLNLLTSDQKKERFFNQNGGEKSNLVWTEENKKRAEAKKIEVAAEVSKKRKKMGSDVKEKMSLINKMVSDMQKNGSTKEDIAAKVREEKGMILKDVKEKRQAIEKYKKENVAPASQKEFDKMSQEEKIIFINKNPQNIVAKKNVMSQLLGTAEHVEASNQVLGKKSVEAKLALEKEALKKEEFEKRKEYIDKESDINTELTENKERLNRAEKREVKEIDNLSDKFKDMYEAIGEGDKVKGKTSEDILEMISMDERFNNNESIKEIVDAEKEGGYVKNKENLIKVKNVLDKSKSKFNLLKDTLDTDERDSNGRLTENAIKNRNKIAAAENDIKIKENAVVGLEKNISKVENDIKRVFEKSKNILENKANSEKKNVKEEYSDKKSEISNKRAEIEKQAREVKENLAAGIHVENPNINNINPVVSTIKEN